MEDRWLSIDEMAAYLGSNAMPHRWISEKLMPVHKVGRPWMFRKEETHQRLKSGSDGGTNDD